MPPKDPRIDAYIEKSAAFAKPILNHLRKLIHKACPQVEETMKWSFPHFDYKGEMMCSMASFKQHCSFGFWKASLMKDPVLLETAKSEVAMGHLGRITSLKDLPTDKQLTAWIKEAMKLNDEGVKVKKEKPVATKEISVPADLIAALKKNKKAFAIFEQFPPSHRKEYIQWIEEAKREETRKKRIEQTVEWVAENKQRNWKYM
ncbi:MAG: YdeI/OmpD-associated family protein [Chitinophagaceae bacterium]